MGLDYTYLHLSQGMLPYYDVCSLAVGTALNTAQVAHIEISARVVAAVAYDVSRGTFGAGTAGNYAASA